MDLPRERWQQLDALLEAALEVEPADRRAYLTDRCAGHPELLAAAMRLLHNAEQAELAIGESAGEYAPTLMESLRALDDGGVAPTDGDLVGPYRILREIGRGGMGTVYAASRADGEIDRVVALKLVRRGLDTDEVLARFRQERRILASLEHPHIARLYDGGMSDDGRPYLVMELVDGMTVVEWCEQRGLGIEDRLVLFCTICRAVQHAHQKLIVHRDIKPSNILVGADGSPKLLDFGIARLLADDENGEGNRTRTMLRVLTPEYAAPEQVAGGPITTAVDVYGLGLVLFELLTGTRAVPTVGGDMPLLSQAVEPGRRRRRLQGDLDVIVGRALRREPEARYSSASHLADDIEHHLAGRPILARPFTPWQRAARFLNRHRTPTAAAAVVLLSLVAGLGATAHQSRVAARERDTAVHERLRAEQVTAFMVNLFESADPTAASAGPGDTLRVAAVLHRGAERIRSELADQPDLQRDLLGTLAEIYVNMGLFDAAEQLVLDAVALEREPVAGDGPARRLALLARIAYERADFSRADTMYARARLVLGETRPAGDSLYVTLLTEQALVRAYIGQFDSAVAMGSRALAAGNLIPPPVRTRALNNLGSIYYEMGDYPAAEPIFREAWDNARASARPDHPVLATAANNLAATIHYQGRFGEAEPLYREAIEAAQRGLGESHPTVGDFLQNLATLFDDQSRWDDAAQFYAAALNVWEPTLGRRSARTAMLLRNIALSAYGAGRHDEALALLREIETGLLEDFGAGHLYTVVTSTAIAQTLVATGPHVEARSRLERGIADLESMLPEGHHLLETARRDLGTWHLRAGDYETAEHLLLPSYAALVTSRGQDHSRVLETRELIRQLYVAWGRPEQAAEYR